MLHYYALYICCLYNNNVYFLIITLLYCILGKEKFQEGLQLYMSRHAYGNTETVDLWNAWSEVSGTDVAGMMATWLVLLWLFLLLLLLLVLLLLLLCVLFYLIISPYCFIQD